MPAQYDVLPRDEVEADAKGAQDLFRLLKQDFQDLRDVLEPHYLALNDTQRQNLKDRFILANWTDGATTDQQRANSLGYAAAVLFLGLDAKLKRDAEPNT